MDVCIKNINEEEWKEFKSESIHHGMKVGSFFNKIVREHKEKCVGSNWERVLLGKKDLKGILTRKDYPHLKNEFRTSFKMRDK